MNRSLAFFRLGAGKFQEVKDIIDKNGGFQYCRQVAEKLISASIAGLDIFTAAGKNKQITNTLAGLAGYVIRRDR